MITLKRLARTILYGRVPDIAEIQRAEWLFYIRTLRQGMTAFDVGANVGQITGLFSMLVGKEGQVHSFEPVTGTFARLSQIQMLQQHHNVILNHRAVAAQSGTITMHVYAPEFATLSSAVARDLPAHGIDIQPVTTETIASVSLDDYCQAQRIDRIDLLKIDVEGLEYAVLQGAERLLTEKRIGYCLFEVGETFNDAQVSPDDVKYYLARLGYPVRSIIPGVRPFAVIPGTNRLRYGMVLAQPA